jgi:hypothetical protein
MKFLTLFLFAFPCFSVTCPSGSTHIVDTLLTGDGVTPVFGKIIAKGPSSPSGSVLSTSLTISIGTGGSVDFCLVGGPAVKYTATYLFTTSTGKPINSYLETWIVPSTVSTLSVKTLWGGSAAPQYLINPNQLNPAGYAPGQAPTWDGSAFSPASGGGGSGISGAPSTWPTFSTVATSGAYADLSGKPTIPATTAQITESGNLYFTPARAIAAVTWATLTGIPFGAPNTPNGPLVLDASGNAKVGTTVLGTVAGVASLAVTAGGAQGAASIISALTAGGVKYFDVKDGGSGLGDMESTRSLAVGPNLFTGSASDLLCMAGLGCSLRSGLSFGFVPSSNAAAAQDLSLSRLGPGKLAVGNGTPGDFSGTIQASGLLVGTRVLGQASDSYVDPLLAGKAGSGSGIQFGMGDGITAPVAGGSACSEIAYPATITGWRVRSLNGVTGSAVVSVTKNGASIVASAPPTLTAGTSASGSVSTWSTAIAANDLLCFSVTSTSGLNYGQVTLAVTR